MVATADLFIVGTVLDLTGGFLVARGLLISPRTIAARGSAIIGANPVVILGAIEDKADAQFGLGALGLGFSLQATGYFLTLLNETSFRPSSERAFIGIGLALAAAALALLVWHRVRARLVRRSLLAVAGWAGEAETIFDMREGPPNPAWLAIYARVWQPGPEDESSADAIERVFGDVAITDDERQKLGDK